MIVKQKIPDNRRYAVGYLIIGIHALRLLHQGL